MARLPDTDAAQLSSRWLPPGSRCVLWSLVVIFVMFLGAASMHIGVGACRRQAAIREIHRYRGRVESVKRGPEWLRACIGADCTVLFDNATAVHFWRNDVVDDNLLAHLPAVGKLEFLSLDLSRITDAGLVHLVALTSLKRLSLYETRVSDAGLQTVGRLASLEYLCVAGTYVTDRGLVHLKQLTRLKRLCVSEGQFSDGAIAELKRSLPGLCVDD
jgi:hypothetical protein